MDNEIKEQLSTEMETAGTEQRTANSMVFDDIESIKGQEDTAPQQMEFLLDIPLEITVELGKTRITIGDLLKLNQGSVLELDKLTNQPLEIFVNKKLMAEGEVVLVNEKFGIRLTNIVSPGDRVKGLS
jgi:flagellar motor switch protein FliN/FliY